MTRHLVLSAHPDDAVWSAGGRIARWVAAGADVTVFTAFDGSDGTAQRAPREDWRGIADTQVRRVEDAAAVGYLGARLVSGRLPDAALRMSGGQPRYRRSLNLFGPRHEDDAPLVGLLATMIEGRLDADTFMHVPLAAGRHVDHALVRAAAELLDVSAVDYYEDFPYRLRARDHAGLTERCEPVGIRPWVPAALCYQSQANLLLGGRAGLMRALVKRASVHGAKTGTRYADRIWTRIAEIPSAIRENRNYCVA